MKIRVYYNEESADHSGRCCNSFEKALQSEKNKYSEYKKCRYMFKQKAITIPFDSSEVSETDLLRWKEWKLWIPVPKKPVGYYSCHISTECAGAGLSPHQYRLEVTAVFRIVGENACVKDGVLFLISDPVDFEPVTLGPNTTEEIVWNKLDCVMSELTAFVRRYELEVCGECNVLLDDIVVHDIRPVGTQYYVDARLVYRSILADPDTETAELCCDSDTLLAKELNVCVWINKLGQISHMDNTSD